MKIYKIKVNGKSYRVELESIEEVANKVAPTTAAPAVETKKEVAAPAPAVTASGTGKPVPSPIQGSVIDVKVKVGAHVKKGDVIAIIEAMKLENEVVSLYDGVIDEVLVSKGSNVTSGQPLVTVK